MIISAVGASLANVALGILTWLIVAKHLKVNLVASFSLLYAVNMYFQSFGAMSIIKVKAYWFHVRERGVFGAIFGTLISIGVYFAFDWGGSIIAMTKANATGSAAQYFCARRPHRWMRPGRSFTFPAAILIFWVLLDLWLIKDSPEEAGFPHFDTHDASSGQMHVEFSVLDLLKKVFTSKLMLLIACVELTGGVFRYSMTQWYSSFAGEVKQTGRGILSATLGLVHLRVRHCRRIFRRLDFRQTVSFPARAAHGFAVRLCPGDGGADGVCSCLRSRSSSAGRRCLSSWRPSASRR